MRLGVSMVIWYRVKTRWDLFDEPTTVSNIIYATYEFRMLGNYLRFQTEKNTHTLPAKNCELIIMPNKEHPDILDLDELWIVYKKYNNYPEEVL
jgi:hypothetical protein